MRGCCDDEALAQAIRDTFDRIPERSRRKIVDYVCSNRGFLKSPSGLRFEALGRWPGMGNCIGMNMDGGHAIRLRASFVRSASAEQLVEVIAHELAHTEQHAEERLFDLSDECERDVEERLRTWGFENGSTEADRTSLDDTFDEIIRKAHEGKASIREQELPSANFAADAICEAHKAVSVLIRASERWNGCGE